MSSRKRKAAAPPLAPLPVTEGPRRQRIEYMDLEELLKRKHPDNAKLHDLLLLEEMITEYGWVSPPLVDERSGYLAFGHGRLDQLAAMKAAGTPVPEGIEDRDGRWFVPVIRGVSFASDEALLKYLIGDNRAVERGGWGNPKLVEALSRIGKDNLRATGFASQDLVTFLARLKNTEPRGQGDAEAVPDLPKRTVTKLGTLWQLGDHRLLCGETRDGASLRRLCAGATLVMLHADPPYGMGKEAEGIENDNLYEEKLDAFQNEWWAAWRKHLSEVGSSYVWGNAPDLWRWWWRHLEPGSKESKTMVRNEIVWDKGSGFGMRSAGGHSYPPASERCLLLMLGQQFLGNQNKDDYWEGYEPLRAWLEAEREKAGWNNGDVNKITKTHMAGHWFSQSQFAPITRKHYQMVQAAAKKAGVEAFVEDYEHLFTRLFPDAKKGGNEHRRNLSAKLREIRTYFDNTHDAMTDVWQFTRVAGEERFGHATPKPVALVARAIKTSAPPGGLVGVPFAGTGPEFVAAEQWERRAYGVEINPAYCDVIVQRWQTFSGKKARKLAG